MNVKVEMNDGSANDCEVGYGRRYRSQKEESSAIISRCIQVSNCRFMLCKHMPANKQLARRLVVIVSEDLERQPDRGHDALTAISNIPAKAIVVHTKNGRTIEFETSAG